MPAEPSFVPRGFLEVPEFFGVQEDVLWRLAPDWRRAVRLARAREQHELAYRVHLLQLRHRNSVPDLAQALGQRRESLWGKLSGRLPAQEDDLILSAWLTGERRRTFRPEDLFAERPVIVPKFPFMRRRTR
ncbi:MAG: hypothetical protein M0Z40_12320 [Actinomycetota bacterium]|nr:hypothetical protein [Actinomycetota bacterium]MDA8075991.1 hypothetical protein [Actinomycetota bacterium]